MTTDETQTDGRRRARGFPWILLVSTLAALVVLISLGNWQMRRLAWKEDLLATIDMRIHAAPLPFADVVARIQSGEDVEYMPVLVEGIFVAGGEQHVLSTWKGVSGWNIYQPMMTDGGVVFVNRGFVPYDRKDPATRPESLPDGAQAISGWRGWRFRRNPARWFLTMHRTRTSITGRTWQQ